MTAERCPKCQGTGVDPTTGGECGCAPAPTSAGPAWTAGPWRIEGLKTKGDVVAGYIISAGVNYEGDGPASYVGDVMVSAPNARLISAAPDLYEALEAVLEGLERRFPQVSRAEMDACERAHEALAKARGQ